MIKPKILVTGATGRTGGAVGPRARYRLESSFQSVVGTGQLPLLIKGLRIRDGKTKHGKERCRSKQGAAVRCILALAG